MRKKANTIGNLVHESVPVSDNEVRPSLSTACGFLASS